MFAFDNNILVSGIKKVRNLLKSGLGANNITLIETGVYYNNMFDIGLRPGDSGSRFLRRSTESEAARGTLRYALSI